jgi:hypothetical protein
MTASGPATTYSIVLPPGWRRIPARSGSAAAIRAAVREALSVVPKDGPRDRVARFRVELEGRLTNLVREVRSKGAIDLCLPVLPIYGTPMPASFIVSQVTIAALAAIPTAEVLAFLAAQDDECQPVIVDGASGLRIDRMAGPAPENGVELPSRRVDYALPVPGTADQWLVIAFSAVGPKGPDDDIATLLTGLFDAIMTTFQWG